jgi:hypothetical protein
VRPAHDAKALTDREPIAGGRKPHHGIPHHSHARLLKRIAHRKVRATVVRQVEEAQRVPVNPGRCRFQIVKKNYMHARTIHEPEQPLQLVAEPAKISIEHEVLLVAQPRQAFASAALVLQPPGLLEVAHVLGQGLYRFRMQRCRHVDGIAQHDNKACGRIKREDVGDRHLRIEVIGRCLADDGVLGRRASEAAHVFGVVARRGRKRNILVEVAGLFRLRHEDLRVSREIFLKRCGAALGPADHEKIGLTH